MLLKKALFNKFKQHLFAKRLEYDKRFFRSRKQAIVF